VGLLDHIADLCFPEWLYYLVLPPTMNEGSFFSTSSPTPVGGVFDYGYSNRGEVES
jgi:hypothetical protein